MTGNFLYAKIELESKRTNRGGIMGNLTYNDVLTKDILDLLNLSNLPDDEKEKIKGIMEETIKNRIIARVIDALSEEDQKSWENMQSEEDKVSFLTSKNINLEKIAMEEAMIYKYEVSKLIEEMQKNQGQAQAQPEEQRSQNE